LYSFQWRPHPRANPNTPCFDIRLRRQSITIFPPQLIKKGPAGREGLLKWIEEKQMSDYKSEGVLWEEEQDWQLGPEIDQWVAVDC
jgi:hypothetical protein